MGTAERLVLISFQTNFTVNVGANGQLAYDPPSMNASVGDMVSFVFQSKNHVRIVSLRYTSIPSQVLTMWLFQSVFASTFAAPCTSSGTFSSPL